ncbi:MAG: hypothetical protein ACO2PN_18110 [Pyrobaculum sp.]|jgi:hypothetical protein
MRLLLLAVLALAAVALGATYEPHGGCDYDFGAGNGTAYLVVNNPYNLDLSLIITYQRGEHKYSEVRNISNTRVIVFCGLGHGWLYIQQNASQLRKPLAGYPLAVPRYVVLRAGESATMFVITLFAPAAIIATVFFLLVAIKLKPRLKRSAMYALPDELRGLDIWEHANMLLYVLFIVILLVALLAYVSPLPPELAFFDIKSLPIVFFIYLTLSLGGFYLSFRRGVWTYHFLLVSFLINIYLIITFSKSYLLLLLYLILFITVIFTSSVTLFSLYNLFMVFFLFTYGIAVLIYYNVNFGHIIPWSLPLQITDILLVPEVLAVIFPAIVVLGMGFLILVFLLVYGLTMHARATTPHMASWPPLWWWFGLGLFAWDELEARRHLHRLSADYTVVVELSRGERAIIVSADLYGVYLCRFGKRSGVCNNVEWVPYDEVEIKASEIINKETRNKHVVNKVALKIVPLILAYFLTFFIIKYKGLPTVLIIPSYLAISVLPYVYNYLREKIKKYVKQSISQYIELLYKNLNKYIKKFKNLKMHIIYVSRALAVSFIFGFLALDFFVSVGVFIATIIISFRLIKDPELHSYLYPWLEIRLMSVGGLVIGLARGGCLQWAKGAGAPRGRAFMIRDGDCLVVVSPYVDNVRCRLQRYLCGPACPPVRVVGGEGVAVGVLDLQKRRYYYYVVDSSR